MPFQQEEPQKPGPGGSEVAAAAPSAAHPKIFINTLTFINTVLMTWQQHCCDHSIQGHPCVTWPHIQGHPCVTWPHIQGHPGTPPGPLPVQPFPVTPRCPPQLPLGSPDPSSAFPPSQGSFTAPRTSPSGTEPGTTGTGLYRARAAPPGLFCTESGVGCSP